MRFGGAENNECTMAIEERRMSRCFMVAEACELLLDDFLSEFIRGIESGHDEVDGTQTSIGFGDDGISWQHVCRDVFIPPPSVVRDGGLICRR